MIAPPRPTFAHLLHMSDRRGTFEHARFAEPRREHGYCTDDAARVLVVATREPNPDAEVRRLAATSLRFLSDAQAYDGGYRNRMTQRGRWQDRATVEDCWGRTVWGLGTAAARSEIEWIRQAATAQLERAAGRRSPWLRANAFSAVGAAELLTAAPDHRGARDLLRAAAELLPDPAADPAWPWPEPRLAYANGVLPEAMIASGVVLERPALLQQGLDLLAWLLDQETIDGCLSVTPVGGSGPGDRRPAFDQQPIEVAALADACARAAIADGDHRWTDGVVAAVGWFMGANDAATTMFDASTGGGFDGLEMGGANLNQGAESTLAMLSTLQHARHLVPSFS